VVRASDWAVVVENADVRVLDGKLEATDVGVYAGSGTVYASDNAIAGVMRAGLFADNGAQVRARDNRVYAKPGGCEALITGYFDGKLTCQPWFEGPELFRTPRDRARQDFDGYWPQAIVTADVATPTLAAGPVGPGSPQPYVPSNPQQGGSPR